MAVYDLGLTTEQFGELTMAQFELLLARRQEEQKLDFYQVGIVASSVYNANPYRDSSALPVKPDDFVPDYSGERQQQQSVDQQIAILTSIFGCGPGKPGKA